MTGDILPAVEQNVSSRRCSVEGCDHLGPYARGWCNMHYKRWRAHGDPLAIRRPRHETQHGTANEYQNYGCRCDLCKAAMAVYQRNLQSTPCANGCGAPVWGRYRPGAICQKCLATSVREHELHCMTCKEWKPDESFPHATRLIQRRGRHRQCRPCLTEAKRDWRRRNAERSREYDREYSRRRRAAA